MFPRPNIHECLAKSQRMAPSKDAACGGSCRRHAAWIILAALPSVAGCFLGPKPIVVYPRVTTDPASMDMADGTVERAVHRGGVYMGFAERFNRFYTDPTWKASRVRYVSPKGRGDGTTRERAMDVSDAMSSVRPGDQIVFVGSDEKYRGCYKLDDAQSGTYEAPIVLQAERKPGGAPGVLMHCCGKDRDACFNLDGANYVAIDGFRLEGGNYGVRAVGFGYESGFHQVGVAVVNTEAWGQSRDPFFTGQSDWTVWDNDIAHDGGEDDGHGIYLSNGSDFGIVRRCELYDNVASDFQINADPEFSCKNVGVDYDDPACDGSVEQGLGQGVSEYMLVENNYFHHGKAQGPNFTSVRHSLFRNNIVGVYEAHGTSFWQETDNPKLGSSDNRIYHNLFVGKTTSRHVLQFVQHSDRNDVQNNVLVAYESTKGSVRVNPKVVLMEVDATVRNNKYAHNLYVGTLFEGYAPNANETWLKDVSLTWLSLFVTDPKARPSVLRASAKSPFEGAGSWLSAAAQDFYGRPRKRSPSPGPFDDR